MACGCVITRTVPRLLSFQAESMPPAGPRGAYGVERGSPLRDVVIELATEHSEAETIFNLMAGAPDAVRSSLGIATMRLGDAVLLSMRNDVTRFWSKALGFGRTEPVTGDMITEVCEFYRTQGTPVAVLQIAPPAIPEDWEEICAREGIRAASSWIKLVGEVEKVLARQIPAQRPDSEGLLVSPVKADDAQRWGSVFMQAFGMPEDHYAGMASATIGRSNWYPHAVWLDGDLVGAGNMYIDGQLAQMSGAAVLPRARNHGGQTQLLVARARAAAEQGCRVLVAETYAEVDGNRNSSLHNMVRLGFEVAYERRNWVWGPSLD